MPYSYPYYGMPHNRYTMMNDHPYMQRMNVDSYDPYDPRDALPEALELIRQAVLGESEDRAFYEYLISQAPSAEDKRIIAGIRDDEMKHFDMFRRIYADLTGETLPPPNEAGFEQPSSYCAGLRQALLGEQNAVTKYRRILYAMQNRRRINMLTEIITDELRHLGLYNYLYARNNCVE